MFRGTTVHYAHRDRRRVRRHDVVAVQEGQAATAGEAGATAAVAGAITATAAATAVATVRSAAAEVAKILS